MMTYLREKEKAFDFEVNSMSTEMKEIE